MDEQVIAARWRTVRDWLGRGWRWWRLVDEVRCERAQLVQLDERLLSDIGLSAATAEREARRGRFDLPAERWRAPVPPALGEAGPQQAERRARPPAAAPRAAAPCSVPGGALAIDRWP